MGNEKQHAHAKAVAKSETKKPKKGFCTECGKSIVKIDGLWVHESASENHRAKVRK